MIGYPGQTAAWRTSPIGTCLRAVSKIRNASPLQHIVVEPRPSALIESLRSVGYNLPTAIADLIDNSISACAKNVWVTFFWDGGRSWIRIQDDGLGMSEEELTEAMRPGTNSPLDERDPKDLGRFGLGLKTASFSQCRRLTVASKCNSDPLSVRCWDLDYVGQTGKWTLLTEPANGSTISMEELAEVRQGTSVLWERLDRLVGNALASDKKAHDRFLEQAQEVKAHLSMVFHRFIERRGGLKLWVNGREIQPWDPFGRGQKATQHLPQETLPCDGAHVVVQPYVLPHVSKLSDSEHGALSGPKGWNAQQGFYVYRGERLLVPGDWLGLGFQKEEHYKLARIQVDLPNSVDQSWCLDVKKSRAMPPDDLRADLRRIAKLTRERAASVYRHRGKLLARSTADEHIFPWIRELRRGRIRYVVNPKHPLVKKAISAPKEYRECFQSLLRLLEETVPVPLIVMDNAETPDKQAAPFETAAESQIAEVMRQVFDALRRDHTVDEARHRLLSMEPFQHFPELVATLFDS